MAFAAALSLVGLGSTEASSSQLETHRDLIQKAQNLTLQRDRLQASQVLLRGLQRENKSSPAYKELLKSLNELTTVFYTEKAQSLFASAETIMGAKPREALESLQEALRVEDGNVAILKAVARAHLILDDCDRADASLKSAEALSPFAAEIQLLRLQILDCQKKPDAITERLIGKESEFESIEKFTRGLQMKEFLRKKDMKKAKALLVSWENQSPDYPEVYFWKWETSRRIGVVDRAAAVKYVQLCQNLTPRRRKSYILDVDLCKGKEEVEIFLKDNDLQPSSPLREEPPNV